MSEVLNVGVRPEVGALEAEVLNEYYDTPAEKQNRIKKQTHADDGGIRGRCQYKQLIIMKTWTY